MLGGIDISLVLKVIPMGKVEKEKKLPMPLKLSESIMVWVREEASKENRSINNFIETKLREIKDADKDIRID